jgi:hypothetical protein
MFAGRIGAIVYAKRKNMKKGPRRRLSEIEMDKYKNGNRKFKFKILIRYIDTDIEDSDIIENTQTKVKFRKIPYSSWTMGLIFFGGALGTIYLIFEELMTYKHHS